MNPEEPQVDSPQIYCPYTNLQAGTTVALANYTVNFVNCTGDKWAYTKYFQDRWDEGKTFISVDDILCDMTCSVDDCARPVMSRGWCSLHYQRWERHGDPLGGRFYRPRGLTEREAFAWYMPGDPPPPNECWDWTGGLAAGRYGNLRGDGGRLIMAHVASHKIYNTHDPITAEKPCVLHSCDRPICCQPAHLHAGTQIENIREALERRRHTHGGRHYRARLKEPDVLFIRQSTLPNVALANMFGVHANTISCIRLRKSWKHLP